ncbi:hypothetical protein RUND412_005288 [Rhizina undulata]
MSYPNPNRTGSYPSTHNGGGGPLSYSSSSSDGAVNGTSATDYSTDAGYSDSSMASNNNNFEFVPSGYQTHHGIAQAYAPPYHPQQHQEPSSTLYPFAPQQYHQHRPEIPVNMQPLNAHAPVQALHPAPPPATEQAPTLAQQQQQQPQQSHQQQQYQRIARFVGPPPVALACTECRSRHLKCNAGVPSCSRCLTDKRECSYVKSRRGWKGTRRKKAAAQVAEQEKQGLKDKNQTSFMDTEDQVSGSEAANGSQQSAETTNDAAPPILPGSPGAAQANNSNTAQPALSSGNFLPANYVNPLEAFRAHYKNSTRIPSQQEPPIPPSPTANLIQLYYAYFHSAHPFCLPPAFLIKSNVHQLTTVLTVMRYIAAFFASTATPENLKNFKKDVENILFSPDTPPPRNAYTVQALTLFAIGLHSDNEQERSGAVKDQAIEMALELGMNMKEFAESAGGEDQAGKVLAESWRRTWWELYFLDGLLAGIHQKDSFRLWSVECTVPLPCEEFDYATGNIPEPHSLQEFDERYFSESSTVFSSFAYRVEAVRILGQVLAAGQDPNPEDPRADAADASLVNWGLHLPECKKELVGKDRRVDEMLFQAHMVINASTINLHRPKSHIAIALVPDDTSCTPPAQWSTSPKPIAQHTAKAINAANTISKLITLPCPLIKHTPFFTCVITLGAIVHLSACSWLLTGDEGFLAKERIRLGVGALKTLEEVWSVAGCVLQQVKSVAREVFSLPAPMGSVGGGGIITEAEVMKFIEDERTLEIVGGEADYHGLPALDWDGTLG